METENVDVLKNTIIYLTHMGNKLLVELEKQKEIAKQYLKFLKEASDCLTDKEKENSELLIKIHELENIIEEYRQPLDPDTSWSPEDLQRTRTQPGWRYIKPYKVILSRIHQLYPGLQYALRCYIREERKHFYATRVSTLKDSHVPSEIRLSPNGEPLPLSNRTREETPAVVNEVPLDNPTQENSQDQNLAPSIFPDLAKTTATVPDKLNESTDSSFSIISDDLDDDIMIIDTDVPPRLDLELRLSRVLPSIATLPSFSKITSTQTYRTT